jgi:hypothetical protein
MNGNWMNNYHWLDGNSIFLQLFLYSLCSRKIVWFYILFFLSYSYLFMAFHDYEKKKYVSRKWEKKHNRIIFQDFPFKRFSSWFLCSNAFPIMVLQSQSFNMNSALYWHWIDFCNTRVLRCGIFSMNNFEMGKIGVKIGKWRRLVFYLNWIVLVFVWDGDAWYLKKIVYEYRKDQASPYF